MEKFCHEIPKVELHAHLNGSCSEKTMLKLIRHKNLSEKFSYSNSSLQECFATFKLLHELVNDEETVYIVTSDVIEEFSDDNVKYLELRTTPRAVSSTNMTKSSYVDSVIKAVQDVCSKKDIIVKLLLSIDRGRTIEDAWDTLKLAEDYAAKPDPSVVGLDFSGNPSTLDGKKFIPVLRAAKEKNLKLTVHMAEVLESLDETEEFLSPMPDRIGHATFLHPDFGCSEDILERVLSERIPIEICMTSNVKSGTVSGYSSHHLNFWMNKQHPCIICTDDKGVFGTSLSEEYTIAASTFNLNKEQIWNLSYGAIDWIFSDSSTKEKLKEKWNCLKSICFHDLDFCS